MGIKSLSVKYFSVTFSQCAASVEHNIEFVNFLNKIKLFSTVRNRFKFIINILRIAVSFCIEKF